MARGSKKDGAGTAAATEEDPAAAERRRLRKLAAAKNMLSESAATPLSALSPSKTVLKHHGKDIIKKSQRKNRFLFSFPGLLGPISGGKIGELKDLGTKNPILYLDFPQGQMKLFGTIVYPKNRYLTLQFSKGGKNVMCEDCFDNMIIFSDAWWIGKKDENANEARLEFPKELNKEQQEDDFKGGIGVASGIKIDCSKGKIEQESPNDDLEDDLPEGERKSKDMEATPVRQSARTAGKKFNFAEVALGDDSVDNEDNLSEREESEDNKDVSANYQLSPKIQESKSVSKSQEPFESNATEVGGLFCNNHGPLVQSTISTLFKKAQEKKEHKTPKRSASSKVSAPKLQPINVKRKADQALGSHKKSKKTDERKAGRQITRKERDIHEAEDDDIEEFSSSPEDDDGSDEDWAA